MKKRNMHFELFKNWLCTKMVMANNIWKHILIIFDDNSFIIQWFCLSSWSYFFSVRIYFHRSGFVLHNTNMLTPTYTGDGPMPPCQCRGTGHSLQPLDMSGPAGCLLHCLLSYLKYRDVSTKKIDLTIMEI